MNCNTNSTGTSKTPNRYAHFTRTPARQSTYVCINCGKRTRDTGHGEGGTDLCRACLDEAELENAHSDGEHNGAPMKGCPECEARYA